MDALIKALTILRKYGNPRNPCHCEHDVLFIQIDPADVSAADIARLKRLGVFSGNEPEDDADDEVDEDGEFFGGFYSYRFGSC